MKLHLLQILIVLILVAGITGCSENGSTNSSQSAQSTSIPDSIKAMYEIIKFKDNPIICSIYVKDTSKINLINGYLKDFYGAPDKAMLLNYFDDSAVAKIYFDVQLDDNVSDKRKDELSKHFIAIYNCNPPTNYSELFFRHR